MQAGAIRRWIAPAALLVATLVLFLLPEAGRLARDDGRTVRAEVVETDDLGVALHGMVEFGTQRLKVRLGDGTIREAANELRAQLELDKKFTVGDTALVILPERGGQTDILVARDHWRMGWICAAFASFAVFLWAFGGLTGLKALFSFVFSCLAIWKLLIPLALKGCHASTVSFLTVAVLTAIIMYLVAGWNRKGFSAFAGAMLGVFASLALAHLFSRLMHVNGATMPFAQQLLYAGVPSIDLMDVFVGAIVLASSGAVMDLAMDIASGIDEVALADPSLGFRALFRCGTRLGRAVVGTMTTTLLLAYSGGYLTLLMVFASQGTSPADFLNSTVVSAEIVKTIVGSFGLVLVAPFTAVAGAWFCSRRQKAGDCRCSAD
ncbi:MAG: YibE/F family protein [Kiritimatiellia bacterium]